MRTTRKSRGDSRRQNAGSLRKVLPSRIGSTLGPRPVHFQHNVHHSWLECVGISRLPSCPRLVRPRDVLQLGPQLRQGARLVQWSRHISHRPHLQGVPAAALDMSACLSLSPSVCLSLATYICLARNYVCIISTAIVYILSVLLHCVLYLDCMKNCVYHVHSLCLFISIFISFGTLHPFHMRVLFICFEYPLAIDHTFKVCLRVRLTCLPFSLCLSLSLSLSLFLCLSPWLLSLSVSVSPSACIRMLSI